MVKKNNNHSNTNSSLYQTFFIKKQLNVILPEKYCSRMQVKKALFSLSFNRCRKIKEYPKFLCDTPLQSGKQMDFKRGVFLDQPIIYSKV